MRFNWFFFDLDGTLIDTLPGIQYSADQAIKIVLPGHSSINLANWIGPPIRTIFSNALPGLESSLLGALEKEFRISYDQEGWKRSKPYDGVLETLAWLNDKNKKSLIITNKPRYAAQSIVNYFKLGQYFIEIITPDSNSPQFESKLTMAQFLISKYWLKNEEILFIGDSMDDYLAAQSNNIQFAGVVYSYGRLERKPNEGNGFLPLKSFSDIRQFLE